MMVVVVLIELQCDRVQFLLRSEALEQEPLLHQPEYLVVVSAWVLRGLLLILFWLFIVIIMLPIRLHVRIELQCNIQVLRSLISNLIIFCLDVLQLLSWLLLDQYIVASCNLNV